MYMSDVLDLLHKFPLILEILLSLYMQDLLLQIQLLLQLTSFLWPGIQRHGKLLQLTDLLLKLKRKNFCLKKRKQEANSGKEKEDKTKGVMQMGKWTDW